MTFRVVIEEQAADDITAHALWIVSRGAPENAARWVEGIEEAIRSLAFLPERCPLAAESDAFEFEIRQLLFKSHRVLFVIQGKAVHVLHVRHAARLPVRPDE